MISIFIIFALLYWVSMARIVRSQILILKESEYVTAARALGASSGRIIKKHLLTNCIGTLIVTTTLQIPASIFTESYLSFIGLGVAAPLQELHEDLSEQDAPAHRAQRYPLYLLLAAAEGCI
jgi:oligopeptide transport system permease protein